MVPERLPLLVRSAKKRASESKDEKKTIYIHGRLIVLNEAERARCMSSPCTGQYFTLSFKVALLWNADTFLAGNNESPSREIGSDMSECVSSTVLCCAVHRPICFGMT